jgi:pilus assembly protein CpaF
MNQHLRLVTSPTPVSLIPGGFQAAQPARPRHEVRALDPMVVAVVARIKREVAARLTEVSRRTDGDGDRLADGQRADLIREFISDALDAYATEQLTAGRQPLRPDDESRVSRSVADALLGAGGLQTWLDNDLVEEVVANGCDSVFVRYADGTYLQVDPLEDSDDDLIDRVRLLAARSGDEERRWDRAAPMLNLQLPDGSRLNATLGVSHRPSVTVRRHRYMRITLAELAQLGTVDALLISFLRAAIRAKLNIIIAGETGGGKTTLARALGSEIEAFERLITIEDPYELGFEKDPAHPNVVALQAREANIEGHGRVDMAALFRNALRMAPDRVIVGEVRGDETVSMLNAMSQGNDGSLSTIHASSSLGVFRKLALYAAQAPERLDMSTTNLHIAEGLHLIVHIARVVPTVRAVTSVREVVDADALQVSSNEILRPGRDRRAVPGAPMSHQLLDRLTAHGFDPTLLERRDGWWS